MEKIIVRNPSKNYKIIDEFEQTSFDEVDTKVIQARNAFAIWSSMSLQGRISILQKLLDEFKSYENEIIQAIALEVGMPVTVCKKIDFDSGIMHMQGYLDNAEGWLASEVTYEKEKEIHTLYYEPFGVVGISVPWNYPFSNFIWSVIPNLIVGNTVVIKHSENCMLAAKLLEKIIQLVSEVAGACQFVYGFGVDVGNYLIHSDVDYLWFIGSTQTGSIIHQAAAQQGIPVTLELGGSAPGIVMQDADLDMAIPSIYNARFINSGQSCDALKRLLVHESIFDEVVEKLVAYVKTKKVGIAVDTDTDIGPLVNQKQLEALQRQVSDAVDNGAKIMCGGKVPDGLQGAYYEPTILINVSLDMAICNEEVFGPVLPVISFSTQEEAVELANDTEYGLGAYVYTTSEDVAEQICASLKAGNISVNDTSYVVPQNPFGGFKKDSGFGRVHGRYGLQSLCNIKVVACKK